MTELAVHNLTVQAKEKGKALVQSASFPLRSGEFVALLGPNGAGKTSLLRGSLGLIPAVSGRAQIDGQDMETLSPSDRARLVSYLPQARPVVWPNSVLDIVSLGRFSHGVSLGELRGADRDAVDNALAACSLLDLAERSVHTLSGGEMARVHCARAFAAEAPLLVADEPTAALDPRHQFTIMDLFADYVAKGRGVLVVLHEISLAMRYASRVLVMQGGKIIADGAPEAVLTEALLRDVYGVEADISGQEVVLKGAC